MVSGLLFDIKEFAVHDGPGIRTTVFLKGCPLRCSWCHNPEGQFSFPEIMHSRTGRRRVGEEYTSVELADILNRQGDILRANEGGATFSGGEPLMQADFVSDVIDRLNRLHVVLDTCGHAPEAIFKQVCTKCDLIHFDFKIMDPERHRQYTGVDNELILKNLNILFGLNIPCVIRIPLIPGVTDTDENLEAMAEAFCRMPNLIRVDLLRYNKAAGGKYTGLGRRFSPGFDELSPVNANEAIFEKHGLKVALQ